MSSDTESGIDTGASPFLNITILVNMDGDVLFQYFLLHENQLYTKIFIPIAPHWAVPPKKINNKNKVRFAFCPNN